MLLLCLGNSGVVISNYFSGYILANVGQDLMEENNPQLSFFVIE